jgi:hypothetical protein
VRVFRVIARHVNPVWMGESSGLATNVFYKLVSRAWSPGAV